MKSYLSAHSLHTNAVSLMGNVEAALRKPTNDPSLQNTVEDTQNDTPQPLCDATFNEEVVTAPCTIPQTKG